MESYKAEKNVKALPIKEDKAQLMKPLDKFIKPSNIGDFDRTERLSKRLARLGVASRRQSEKLIE